MINQLITFLFSFILAATVFAQENATVDSSQGETADHHAIEYRNHIAVFNGVTSQLDKKGNDYSLGLDYVRKFTEDGMWAGSVFAEAIFHNHTEWVFGLVIVRRLGKAFWVRTGPGIEIIQEEDHDSHDHQTNSKIEFLYRIGCGYPFHFDWITVTPSIDLDFLRSSTALVWGINIEKSF